MGFQPADSVSLTIFILFAFIMALTMSLALRLSSEWRKWNGGLIFIILLFGTAASSGILLRSFIPLGPFLFASLIVYGFWFAFSRAGRDVAIALPFAFLIGFQGFRLPLELILHHWAGHGTVPGTMTWTGQNWDILSGIVALISIPWVNKNRVLAWAANSIGFILLLNVLRVVVMSSPLPFAWQLENPLLLIAYFPYALIGPLFVLPALVGHLLVFRKLKSQ